MRRACIRNRRIPDRHIFCMDGAGIVKGPALICVSAGMAKFIALCFGAGGMLVLIGLALIVPVFAFLIRRPRL